MHHRRKHAELQILPEVCHSIDMIFHAGNYDATNDKDSECSFYTTN